MKRFLKEKNGIDQYPDVSIEWIRHHNPDLTIYENGKPIQTIDLGRYNYNQLHELFQTHFAKRGSLLGGRMLSGATDGSEELLSVSSNSSSQAATATAATARARGGAAFPSTTSERAHHDAALPQPDGDDLSLRGRQAAELAALSLAARRDHDGGGAPSPQLVGGVVLTVALAAWLAVRRARPHHYRAHHRRAAAPSSSGSQKELEV